MKINVTASGDATILELEGNLTAGSADEVFSSAMERQLDADRPVVVIDMKHVAMVDSTGLGSLVRSHHRGRQAGGGIRLVNLDFRVWELFEAAQLAGVIPIFENRQHALEGLPES